MPRNGGWRGFLGPKDFWPITENKQILDRGMFLSRVLGGNFVVTLSQDNLEVLTFNVEEFREQ